MDGTTQSPPWRGSALPLPDGAMERAAETIGCEVAAIRAVYEVEAAGRAYEDDGSVVRRFEPHHFPREHAAEIGWTGSTWRDALRISRPDRREMFGKAAAIDMEAACRAASWGAPQIMGFNHLKAGHGSAVGMVSAFAEGEAHQLRGFVNWCMAKGLDADLRAHDWRAFAEVYNGPGKADAYARKIETAYKRLTGHASPVVVAGGMRGQDVKRLQRALNALAYEVTVDGVMGPETAGALRAFQKSVGLKVDGLAGAKTWAALEQAQAERARAQPDSFDKNLDRASQAVGIATGLGLSWASLNDTSQTIVIGAAVVCALAFGGLMIWRKVRRERRS